MKKGGAAKGELVLAIFELANCFRHGWGIDKDPVAAKQVRPQRSRAPVVIGLIFWEGCFGHRAIKLTDSICQYYETAANLGDTGMISYFPSLTMSPWDKVEVLT